MLIITVGIASEAESSFSNSDREILIWNFGSNESSAIPMPNGRLLTNDAGEIQLSFPSSVQITNFAKKAGLHAIAYEHDNTDIAGLLGILGGKQND